MIRVLAVASEVFPLVKTGGLADVVGALPAALAPHDVDMQILIPGYPAVRAALRDPRVLYRYPDLFGGSAALLADSAAGLGLIVLDAPHLYDREGNPYVDAEGRDWVDNAERFAALGRAAADIGSGAVADFTPAVVHAHDWQAGLAPAYLHYDAAPGAKTVVTIHNLAFQGRFPAKIFGRLGLPGSAYAIDGIEYYGGVGYLKAGLFFADAITTVSPTYAAEICTPDGGMGLDGLLQGRRGELTGIVNGLDTSTWDPGADPALAATYDAASVGRRAVNRSEIEKRLELDPGEGPLFCVISRLTWQKGMDLVAACIDSLVAAGGRLAVLGSGDAELEGAFTSAAARHPGRVGAILGYDEKLAHLLQGGSDMILVPSRFEPCGLTQLAGLRYGCVPVASRLGGLADTIIDANDAALAAGAATGLHFLPVDTDGLERAIHRSILLRSDRPAWATMQAQGMRSDVSWARSATRYAALYRGLAEGA